MTLWQKAEVSIGQNTGKKVRRINMDQGQEESFALEASSSDYRTRCSSSEPEDSGLLRSPAERSYSPSIKFDLHRA
jgi:hypothetical protein